MSIHIGIAMNPFSMTEDLECYDAEPVREANIRGIS
jgi:hypothetical protein